MSKDRQFFLSASDALVAREGILCVLPPDPEDETAAIVAEEAKRHRRRQSLRKMGKSEQELQEIVGRLLMESI